jgi:hypothetical protein
MSTKPVDPEAAGNSIPHAKQNRASSGLLFPHRVQNTSAYLTAMGRTGEPVAPLIRSVRFTYRNS